MYLTNNSGRFDAAAIRDVLESAGVEFTNGDEPGVKLSAKGKRAR